VVGFPVTPKTPHSPHTKKKKKKKKPNQNTPGPRPRKKKLRHKREAGEKGAGLPEKRMTSMQRRGNTKGRSVSSTTTKRPGNKAPQWQNGRTNLLLRTTRKEDPAEVLRGRRVPPRYQNFSAPESGRGKQTTDKRGKLRRGVGRGGTLRSFGMGGAPEVQE